MHCDDRATVGHLMIYYPMIEILDGTKWIFNLDKITPEQLSFQISISMLSIYVALLTFSLKENDLKSHPKSHLRKNRIASYIELFFPDEYQYFQMYNVNKAIIDVFFPIFLTKTFGTYDIPDSLKSANQSEEYDYDEVDPKWKDVVEKLKPFMRGEMVGLGFKFGQGAGSVRVKPS